MSENMSIKNKMPQLKRVAAVHDLCGYGNCSLAIALPVISAAGIDCLPFPTAYLSTHTKFENYTFVDTTPNLDAYLASWRALGFALDAIYTGFLGSGEQIAIIEQLLSSYPQAISFIDPVMGDEGKIYATYTPDLCARMRSLVQRAFVLTPNLTEAAILLDEEYQGREINLVEAERICYRLLELGAQNIVLKGILRGNQLINMVYSQSGLKAEVARLEVQPYLHGSGDLFASTFVATFLSGYSLVEACEFAADITGEALIISAGQTGHLTRGISFEPLLGKVADKCLSAQGWKTQLV